MKQFALCGVALAMIGGDVVAAPAPAGSADCAITYNADDDMTAVIQREHFDFKGYDALCSAMEAGNLQLAIDSDFGTLSERAYAWVRVRLARQSTTVRSAVASSTTTITTPADATTAANTAMDALNQALETIAEDKDHYIQSVAAEEVRLRAALAAKPTDKH